MTSKSDSRPYEPRNRYDRFKGIFRRKITTQGGSELTESGKISNHESQPLRTSHPQSSAGGLPESQHLELATYQGPRPPQTKRQGHSSNVVADEDGRQSRDLWMHAYEALKIRNPDLVTAYERYLASADVITTSAFSSLSPELIEAIVKPKLEDREANRLVVRLGREPVKVREQGEKLIRFILWSNNLISAAVSAQPYAALAWSGVSILLPLLLNASQQSHAMIEGLTSISDLLRLYRIKEKVYLQDVDNPAHPDLVKAIEELYTDIFEYQGRLIYYLSCNSAKRGVRGTLVLDDWKGMLEKIKTSDNRCKEYSAVFSEEKEHQFYTKESSYIEQSIDIQKRVLDMFEASRALGQQERRDDKEAELLETLASDYESDKDSISARVPGTCEWFFEDEKFLNWRDSKFSRILWVSAGPGCGKSVLSRCLVDERRVCTNAMASTVCYFFFKDGQEHRTSGANALSAILHQLFENATLIPHALSSYRKYGKKLRDSFSELWGLLVESAKDPEAGEIICILDALDECEEDARNQLLNKLVGFFLQMESCEKPSFTLKFLVTSRPYDNLEQKFIPLSDVSTYLHFDGDDKSQKISQEIDLVIDAKIPDIVGDFSDEDRNCISDRLKKMNHRTYLWLFLTIDIISGSRSNFRKASSIDMLLSNLPSKVSDAYERILAKSSNKDLARILFQIIVAATRPLSLTEVNVALTVATQKFCTSEKALKLWPIQSFRSTVQNICGLFVSVHDGKISLIHQTAREFLIGTIESRSTHLDKWQGCIDMATAHGAISNICLAYLDFEEFAGKPPPQHEDDESCRFFHYATLNWTVHYTSQHSESAKKSIEIARRLCNTSIPQQTNWFQMYCSFQFIESKGWNNMEIASFLGLIDVAESFLNEGADVNAQGGVYGNALQAASLAGHGKMVQMLLEAKADVNAQGGYYGNALQAASSRGYDETVRMLLEKGADINAQGGEFGNALQAASSRGYDEVVQILLEKGADVNAQGGYYGNALQAASSGGYDEVVQILLEKGADVNAQGGEYGNALQAASSEGSDKMVQILLEKGADVNAQGGYYGNALQAASFRGYDKVVQILLEKGADVNAQGGGYGNALQTASFWGYDEVVRTLLEKGADVNAQGGYYGNALQAASSEGSDKVVQILLEKGADINAQGGGYGNALQAASHRGHHKVVRTLLEKGADMSSKDMQGRTPLHFASTSGHLEIVEKLFTISSDPLVTDKQGRNCLHHAASKGSIELVTWLLKKGFDPNLADRDNWTSLHWAAKSGSVGTVRVLKDAGCTSTIEAIEGWTPHLVAIFHQNSCLQHEQATGQNISPWAAAAVGSIDDERKVRTGVRHKGFSCDGCSMDIYGARYHCLNCRDFDYCFKCKASSDETHDDHKFEKLE